MYCTFNRSQPNNNESGTSKTKFDYNKIFNIKPKQSGPDGTILFSDDGQFKDRKKFKDQQIQYVTRDTSVITNFSIAILEKRTKGLFKDLWSSGISQNIDGPENKLVRISEEQAVEVAHIVKKFNSVVKGI